MWLLKIAGLSKVTKGALIVLAVISILLIVILYIQKGARDNLIQELQIEQLQQSQSTSKRIRDEVNKIDNTVNDPASAYEWLYNRARDSN